MVDSISSGIQCHLDTFLFAAVYFYLLLYVHWCFAPMHVWVRVTGHGVTDCGELPRGCWEQNLGPLEEQSVLLNNEPFFQPQFLLFLIMCMCSYVYWCSCPQSPQNAGFPGGGVICSCEPPRGCWELNPGPLEEQPLLLNHLSSPVL